MAGTLAERSTVPFHLGLTEPIDETAIAGYPAVEGAYDPVEQIWRLPDGMPLTDPQASEKPFFACESLTTTPHGYVVDDIHVE